jgi:hypothetical protein
VVLLMPALASYPRRRLAPTLLLFLVPAPLAVVPVLAGADALVVVGAQSLGLLVAASMTIVWPRLATAATAAALDGQRLGQIGLLLGLGLVGNQLLAVGTP